MASQSGGPQASPDEEVWSVRLEFEYDGPRIDLRRTRRIQMVPPPTDDVGDLPPHSGFWVELQDDGGRVLYRRFENDPIQTSVEVLSGDAGRPFERHAVEHPRGTFTVLVPDLPEATSVRLVGDSFRTGEAAQPLGRFDVGRGDDREGRGKGKGHDKGRGRGHDKGRGEGHDHGGEDQ